MTERLLSHIRMPSVYVHGLLELIVEKLKMAGVNKVFLIGRIGKDPELKSFPNGGAVCNVSMATSESWKDKQGNPQEQTEWHNVVFHDKLAEVACKYLSKGSQCYVEGKLRTRKWQDKGGQDRYTTEVSVLNLQLLDPKSKDGGKPSGDAAPAATTAASRARAAQAAAAAASGETSPAPWASVDFDHDDDIPF